jgi:phosphoglycolate phosphatase-like HAD superfamily hydrolase
MQEQGPYEGDGPLADNPSLTRQALRAQAEELAVELARWKVWRVEGHTHENLQEAQAMQALAMVLVELLDDVHGSHAAVQTELARAVSLLGYKLQAHGAEAVPETLCTNVEASGDDAAFLRTHGLRFSEQADEPLPEP